ncbi:MAG: leucine-rich repeat protein [Ruminococcaceae bacterium]|nr:leucine-rich repeat protein [Oscillospiraceae bacterium]
MEYIEQYAVTGCKNLEEITIPKSLKRVYMKAFMWCERLSKVYYEGSEEEWNKIDFTMFNDYLTNAHINYNCRIFKGENKS